MSLDKDSEALKKLAVQLGYRNKEATRLRFDKIGLHQTEEEYKKIVKGKEKLSLGRIIPLKLFGTLNEWKRLTDQQKKDKLWGVGVDTRGYEFFLDVGCTSEGDKKYCGYLLTGQERTDKEWIRLIIQGKHVASWEAQMAHKNDWSLQEELMKLGGNYE